MDDFYIPCLKFTFILIFSCLNFVAGGIAIFYGLTQGILHNRDIQVVGETCPLLSLVAGIALILSCLVWIAGFIINAVNKSRRKDPYGYRIHQRSTLRSTASRGFHSSQSSPSPKGVQTFVEAAHFYVFVICFLCSFGLTIGSLDIFWEGHSQLNKEYIVVDNCFCRIRSDMNETWTESGQELHLTEHRCDPGRLEDLAQHSLGCISLYEEESVMYAGVDVITRPCQDLRNHDVNQLCEDHKSFDFWFRILRVILPFVSSLQLLIIVLSCAFRFYNKNANKIDSPITKNTVKFDLSWVCLDGLETYSTPSEPFKRNNKIFSFKDRPPKGDRLGPYGQEQESEFCSSVTGNLQTDSIYRSSRNHELSPGKRKTTLVPVTCPTVPMYTIEHYHEEDGGTPLPPPIDNSLEDRSSLQEHLGVPSYQVKTPLGRPENPPVYPDPPSALLRKADRKTSAVQKHSMVDPGCFPLPPPPEPSMQMDSFGLEDSEELPPTPDGLIGAAGSAPSHTNQGWKPGNGELNLYCRTSGQVEVTRKPIPKPSIAPKPRVAAKPKIIGARYAGGPGLQMATPVKRF